MYRYLLNHVLRASKFMQRIAEHTGVDDKDALQQLLQMGLDDGNLSLFSLSGNDAVEESGEVGNNYSQLFIRNNDVEAQGKTTARLQRSVEETRRRSMAPDGVLDLDLPDAFKDAVTYLSETEYSPNKLILKTMRTLAAEGFFDPKRNQMEHLMLQEFSNFGEGNYYLPLFPDFRYRLYTDSRGVASYQGGDCHRAVCDFAEKLPASDEDIQIFLEVIEKEYGVTEDNYEDILADPVKFVKDCKDSKPFCALRAAEAIREMKEEGCSGYILQQDQSASGPAWYGWFTGDEALCHLTNLYPSDSPQSLYTAMSAYVNEARLLPVHVRDNPMFVDRKTAKTFAVPMIYSAANPSLTRGAILKNPQTSPIQYMDNAGDYIVGSLEKVSKLDLNERYAGVWQALGWSLAVRVASDVARAYETSLFGSKTVAGLTSRLRPAMMAIKTASRNRRNDGQVLNWTSPSGCRVFNRKMVVDMDAKPWDVNVTFDGKRHRISFQPLKAASSDAASGPNVIHSVDASAVHFMALMAAEAGIRIAPIHDSIGTHISYARWVRAAFKSCIARVDQKFLDREILIPSKVTPLNYPGADRKRFAKSRHILGC